jgi:hypothetical protein
MRIAEVQKVTRVLELANSCSSLTVVATSGENDGGEEVAI